MKTINLREESYNKLKQKLVNESNENFFLIRTSFEDFYHSLEDVEINAEIDGQELNPYLVRIKSLADEINELIYDMPGNNPL